MKRIFIPTRGGSDWQRLLAKPMYHWKKGKSAMTDAASFRPITADPNFLANDVIFGGTVTLSDGAPHGLGCHE
jgi:hypothetical protein